MAKHDWKLNPNVQIKIILDKLDYEAHKSDGGGGDRRNNLHQMECTKNQKSAVNSETENDSTKINNSRNIQEQLENIFEKCEPECSVCWNFINQLTLHIQNSHTSHEEIPPEVEAPFTVPEFQGFQCNSADIPNHTITIIKRECESENFNQFNQILRPSENLESESLTFQSVIEDHCDLMPHPDISSASDENSWSEILNIATNLKIEPNETDKNTNANIELVDPLYNPYENCGSSVPSSNDIVSTVNNESNTHKCNNCGISFPSFNDLVSHNIGVIEIGVECANLTPYNQISTVECAIVKRQHKCYTCGVHFPTVDNLNEHINNKHSTVDKSYECETSRSDPAGSTNNIQGYCDDETHNETLENDTDAKTHTCKNCGTSFPSLNDLVGHNVDEILKHVKCTRTPGQSQNTVKNLKRKLRHKCCTCGVYFETVGKLNEHIIKHTIENPYECVTCGKKFPYRHSLTVHKRVHSGERPFSCGFCDKRFPQKAHLIKHLKTHGINNIHDAIITQKSTTKLTGSVDETISIRNVNFLGNVCHLFSCQHCDKRFLKKSSLQTHEHHCRELLQ